MNTVNLNNTYPIFEADQVLTADHLNEMFNYLEEQERWTRAKLIGSGIVCGLKVSLTNSNNTVVITKGAGLSSKGYLITFNEQEPKDQSTEYSYFTTYSDPNDDKYSFFRNNDADITLYELQETKIEDAETLNNLPSSITEYGVILYLECLDKKLKNCVENDCNEKGTERIFTLRKLLVSKTDLRRIICEEQSLNVPKSEAQLEEIVNARYKVGNLQLPRFANPGGVPVTNYQQFYLIYKGMIDSAMDLVRTALLKSFDYFYPIFREGYGTKVNFQNLVNITLQNHYNNLMNSDLCQLQYFYDMLCDMADNHNDFINAAFDLMSECCPDLDRFPKHLRLGQFDGADCPPSLYRHLFVQAPIHNRQHELRERVLTLHAKFSLFILNYTDVSSYNAIQITPSVALDQALEKKTIPYYYEYSDAMLKYWNPDLKRKCRQRENLWYHAADYATLPPIQHVLKPLAFNLLPYDFYRIEGHICKNHNTALSEILRLRRVNNLAFDVITLKLGTDESNTKFDPGECSFRDLELMCEAWKKELECLLVNSIKTYSQYSATELLANAAAEEQTVLTLLKSAPAGAAAGDVGAAAAYAATLPAWLEDAGSMTAKVIEAVDAVPGNMGYYFVESLQQRNDDVCVYKDDARRKVVEENAYLGDLTQVESEIAINRPYAIMSGMVGLTLLVDTECGQLDLDKIREGMGKVVTDAQEHSTLMDSYKQLGAARLNYNYTSLANTNLALISNCTLDALELIQAEMEKRKAEIQKKNLFHEYWAKNPGLEHAGGVPKGGTFIMVYQGDDTDVKGQVSETSYIVVGFVLDEDGNGLTGARIGSKDANALITVSGLNGFFRMVLPPGVHTLSASYSGYDFADIVVQGQTNDVIFQAGGTTSESKVPPGTVIADFFLPYLCCSDCPPTTYVFQETGTTLGLDMVKKKFCVPYDEGTESFIVTPTDGEVTGEGVISEGNGVYAFDPNLVDLGGEEQKVVSFSVNGEAQDLEVTICNAPIPVLTRRQFTWSGDNFNVSYLTPTVNDPGTVYSWETVILNADGSETSVGSGTATTFSFSTDQVSPEQTLITRLTINYSNGCIATDDDTRIVPEKGELPRDLEMDVTKFCRPYTGDLEVFEVTPAGGVVTCVTDANAVAKDGENYTFNPNEVDMQGEVEKTLQFRVDDELMQLTITVCEEPPPTVDEVEFAWGTGTFNAAYATDLDPTQHTWQWTMVVVRGGQEKIVDEKLENEPNFTPDMSNVSPGDVATLVLVSKLTETGCIGTSTPRTQTIPPRNTEPPETIEVRIYQGPSEIPPPYLFGPGDDLTYSLVGLPADGKLDEGVDFSDLNMREEANIVIDGVEYKQYHFSPVNKQERSYTLKFINGSESDSVLVNIDISKTAPPPSKIDLEIVDDKNEPTGSTTFNNKDLNTYTLVANPPGGDLTSSDAVVESFFFDIKTGESNGNLYRFVPNQIKEGTSNFTYKLPDGSEGNIAITITSAPLPLVNDTALSGLTGGRAALGDIEKSTMFGNLLDGNDAYVKVSAIVGKIDSDLKDRANVDRYTTGKESGAVAKILTDSTGTTSKAIIKNGKPDSTLNNRQQNFLLKFYRLQVGTAANMVALQEDDLSPTDDLSKHLTVIKRQFITMKKNNVKVDVAKKMSKLLKEVKTAMKDKPKAAAKLDELLNAL